MIEVTNLIKKYGDLIAVNGISFEVQRGEIFGFLGPNGAGKTSVINMMTGLSRPTAGEILIHGIDVRQQTKKTQSLMGIVADESNLYNEMDGFENLCFCAALYGMEKKDREAEARRLLKEFGLKDAGKRPFKAYSKGMKRKLTIAAALIHSPEILFLDEPTTGIDVESSRQIRKRIKALKKQGTTVFLTTHYIEEAERICDRIAFIAGGRIVASGTVPELMDSVSHGHVIQFVANEFTEDLAQELQSSFKGSRAAVRSDNTMIMESEERIPLLPVMDFLHGKGIDVYEAKELRPSLEDVFVRLTGIESSVLKRDEKKGGRK